MRAILIATLLGGFAGLMPTAVASAADVASVPDRVVVLTFDDGNRSDAEFVAPLLKRYGFGATFFVSDCGWFREDKQAYMTWEDVEKLHAMGFEIGNHTRSHPNLTRLRPEQIVGEVEHIERVHRQHGLPRPVSFCYPGYHVNLPAIEVLGRKGYSFARRGVGPEFPYSDRGDRGPAYDPADDHPLMVPTTGAFGPNFTWDDFLWTLDRAKDGRVAVLTFHGVPDGKHPWVNTDRAVFERCMKHLKDNGYTVIAMRDLARYVDPAKRTTDPMAPIERRMALQPTSLKCEYLTDPPVIDTPKPRLSWVPQSVARGQRQTAYRVLVASSEAKLREDLGDKWDSGRVASDRSIHVVYDGKPLNSWEVCYWKVQLWGKQGRPSEWSKPAEFGMGLLSEKDGRCLWIAMGDLGPPPYVPGRIGRAIKLNGHNQSVRMAPRPGLKPKEQITISAWIKPTEIGDQWREIYRKDDGDARQLLAIGRDGSFHGLWCGFGIGGEYVERGAELAPERLLDGEWHLVAATFDGAAIRLYADGKQIGSSEVEGQLDTEGRWGAEIGSLAGRGEFFAGAIDDVRIYGRAISAKEMESLAAAEAGAVSEGLVAHWNFDDNTTDAVSGEAGTPVGTETAPAPRFRKEFEIDKEVRRARVLLSGLGYYELYINGRRVGDRVLDPVTSAYYNDQPYELSTRVYYTAYDVTEYLRPGRNAVGVWLGNGWYSAVSPPEGRKPYGTRPQVLLQMNVELADGRQMSVASYQDWKTSGGPVLENDICRGEVYDARLETPGWTQAEFDDSAWHEVRVTHPPSNRLVAQNIPAAKVLKTFKPVKIHEPDPGVYVFDFGQNMSGWTKLRVQGSRGTEVRLRYSPCIDDDGRLDTRPNRGASQTDTYILKGGGPEQWEPRFTLHGFRYVEVTGLPKKPTAESLEARFVRNDIELAGEFACSNPLLNQIHHNALWTFLCSLQGIPQDAAERDERVAWLGDTGFVWEDYIYNIDMAAFTAKWLWDIRDTQRTTGELAVTAPKWRRSGQVGRRYSPYPCWISTYPLLTWFAYEYYGDTRVLADHYDGLKKMLAYKAQHAPGHIFTHGLGDHMEPQAGGVSRFAPTQTSPLLTSTAYYYYDVLLTARIAEILGHKQDARHYFKLADEIKAAFNEEFFDASAGYYGTGTQTANALALSFDMVPESRREAVVKHLAHDVAVTHNGHLSTGIIGTDALEQTMARHGLAELMYGIATQTTPPSWGYQVRQGATTVWETWEGEPHHCRNMKMLGSSEIFFYRDLAGIAPAAPSFRKIAIRPYVVGDLKWVKASHNTIRGRVAVHWRKGGDSLTMDVTIPANTTATVSVPTLGLKDVTIAESGRTVWKDGEYIDGAEGVAAGRREDDYVTFDVGSGVYSFRVSPEKQSG